MWETMHLYCNPKKKKEKKLLNSYLHSHVIKSSLCHISLGRCPQTQSSAASNLASLKFRRHGTLLCRGLGSHFRNKSTFPLTWWMFILVYKVELNFPLNVCLEFRFDWQGEMGLFPSGQGKECVVRANLRWKIIVRLSLNGKCHTSDWS